MVDEKKKRSTKSLYVLEKIEQFESNVPAGYIVLPSKKEKLVFNINDVKVSYGRMKI